MNEKPEPASRVDTFRTAIAGFIDARREAKLKGQDDDAGTASRYDHATWLADAARRVGQIQAVTHVLKATHPDARGSSLHMAPAGLPPHADIGSHLLDENYAEDVVGNAAALDVFKLLKVEVEGKRLLHWAQVGDTDLQAALCDDAGQAQGWMQAFASLVREDMQPVSHPLAKQLYWLAGDDPQDGTHYHLLQPMFASSLAHAIHTDIQEARFGEVNKQARRAKRDNKPNETSYRDYRNLVARKLGGTKPQNISQLNSERGGVNYLLSSLPPAAWAPPQGPDLRQRGSVFHETRGAFFVFGEVRNLLRELAAFLKTDPDPNKETRNRVNALVQAIAQELALFGASVRGRYKAGWTREADDHLPLCEQLWLDPERTELPLRDEPEHPAWQENDLAFNHAYERGDWADEVAARFGLWLNYQLQKRGDKLAALGESAMRHFASEAILDVTWPIPQQRRAKAGAA